MSLLLPTALLMGTLCLLIKAARYPAEALLCSAQALQPSAAPPAVAACKLQPQHTLIPAASHVNVKARPAWMVVQRLLQAACGLSPRHAHTNVRESCSAAATENSTLCTQAT